MIKQRTFRAKVIPIIALGFWKEKSRKIISCDNDMIITRYTVVTKTVGDDDKVIEIYIDKGFHPNADPLSNKYCLPYDLYALPLSMSVLEKIEERFAIYNLKSYYKTYAGHYILEGGFRAKAT